MADGKPYPPPVPELSLFMEADEEYRSKAEAGKLRNIALRRINPEKASRLPILHVEKDGLFLYN